MRPRKSVPKLDEQQLFEHAVKILGVRSLSTEELKTKLRIKAMRPADVEIVLGRLKDLGYLDERRLAESFATARRDNEGYGKLRVLTDLRGRRVPSTIAAEAVARAYQDADEATLLERFIERRLPALSRRPETETAETRIEDQKVLAAAYRKLRRAGFSSSLIISALKRVAAQPEVLEEPPEEEGAPD